LLMVLETVAIETLARLATVRMSGGLGAVLRDPIRATKPSSRRVESHVIPSNGFPIAV
jgi:hypothetical protein